MASQKYIDSKKILAVLVVCVVLVTGVAAVKFGWLENGVSTFSRLASRVPHPGSLLENVGAGLFSENKEVADGSFVDGLAKASLEKKKPEQQNKKKIHEAQIVDNRKKARIFNNNGVELILKGQFWQGMFLLNKAIELDENHFEANMNMALALRETGLTRSAARFLSKAEQLDGDNPVLQKNYSIILGQKPGNSVYKRKVVPPKVKHFDVRKTTEHEKVLRLWGLDIK